MASKDHVHTYERIPNEKSIRYKCSDPDCTHVMMKGQLKGKRSKCWGCANTFILTGEHLKRARPHCGCFNDNPDNEGREIEIDAVEKIILEQLGEKV
jgi:hypothetical protein